MIPLILLKIRKDIYMENSLKKISDILDKHDDIDFGKKPKYNVEDTITRLRLIRNSNNEVISGLNDSKVDQFRLDYFKSVNNTIEDAILHLANK